MQNAMKIIQLFVIALVTLIDPVMIVCYVSAALIMKSLVNALVVAAAFSVVGQLIFKAALGAYAGDMLFFSGTVLGTMLGSTLVYFVKLKRESKKIDK